ncbi:MAG: DNA/RNA non-specific endonuclease [Bacteroidaceae bacterium]|nr:DNA/RNA non-specific endonuclease [Bacteroidaceae bacterium]
MRSLQFKVFVKFLFFVLPVVGLLYSCGSDDDDTPNVIIVPGGGDGGGDSDGAGLTGEAAVKAYGKRLEVPALASEDGLFVAHESNYGSKSVMNYCLEFSPRAMHSRWVAFRFDGITRQITTGRSSSDAFANDPLLPSQYWIGSEYFRGYNRGHICASADRVWSAEANRQTFYMSNMSPQGGNFNAGIWADYENHFRSKGRDATFADTVYVVKGGTIADGQTLGTVVRSNNTLVRVPRYYFMAFLRVRYGTYDAIGLWLEHRDYADSERKDLAAHLVSIDELEQKTGIDFFHNLPDAIETSVEATYNKTLWGF